MDEASCAGLAFVGEHQVDLYDELECSRSGAATLSARVRALSDDLLLMVEERGAEDAPSGPPRTWIYRIDALTNEHATLTELWTGWGNLQDETIAYRIQPVSQAGSQPVYRVEAMEMGDRACYMTFVDAQQMQHEAMADFAVCDRPLVGHWVSFSYQQARVAAASCQGDPECRDVESVPLIVDAQIQR
ncbi:hypothetical protein CKO42_20270 [Lamprobacter modestohalophilus]|uniref:Uncharacterized protein n=1 Tax=Lamprobacter modestohalophilus TaxID=1064514 RepID=A0A9X0WC78_9GAMM|nr:hypothetical protein [Lamprobacter modestohalophilus]MBK1620722.1 hypothetical protein [Lamprobacter modestohalophilus]